MSMCVFFFFQVKMHVWMCVHFSPVWGSEVFCKIESVNPQVDNIIQRMRNVSDFWPLTVKRLRGLFKLSGLIFYTFAKEVFKRAEMDFYLERFFFLCSKENMLISPGVCLYEDQVKVSGHWFAGQDLASHGCEPMLTYSMHMWDCYWMALTIKIWLQQF